MSGVEYSVSVRAKNGVSDMVPLELRNASTAPAIMSFTSSEGNLTPIIVAVVVCSMVMVMILVVGVVIIIGIVM